jgi:hypothetical protein
MKHQGLNQLLCAAVVNDRFRETLLHNPAHALTTGYFGHSFSLTPEERQLVLDIEANRLEDFASEVHSWLSRNGNGHVAKGHEGGKQRLHRYNGNNGHNTPPTGSQEPFVTLYRAPVLAHS